MRVIAGTAKGHKLFCIKGDKTRPTMDRVKESIFNVLGNRVIDCYFLDLFSGSGAMGIEALSRGAKVSYFNEKNKKAFEIIKKNIQHCYFKDNAVIFNKDAMLLLKMLSAEDIKFDIIYLDPPYDSDLYVPVITEIEKCSLLKDDTIIICESSIRKPINDNINGIIKKRIDKYGDTLVNYYQYK